MNYRMKHGMSMLLALLVALSLFFNLATPTHAAESCNQGIREQVATALTDDAIAFYEENGTSYEELAALTGSATTSQVPSSELYQELQDLMKSNHSNQTSYDATRSMYKRTDCQNGDMSSISSFYSGVAIGPEWDSGATWNREHTWPNSKGLEGRDEDDIMMLRPTATSENGNRGNTAYGNPEDGNYYYPNAVSNGQYDVRGDVARIALYVYTRWGNTSYMWGESGVIQSKSVLLSWMKADPVDTWELSRNDVVEDITGTRNVFIDYPELAFVLFGEPIPSNMTTPSGEAKGAHTITVSVNDANMGTAEAVGTAIMAYPKEGYRIAGYEVISGNATVSAAGIVSTTGDCEIRVIFEASVPATVRYYAGGVLLAEESQLTGNVITLPAFFGTMPQGYTFLGWAEQEVSATESKSAFLTAGSSYTVTGDAALHALFTYTAVAEGTRAQWTLVTNADALSAGNQIVLASKNFGKVAGSRSGAYLTEVAATFSGDKTTITELPSSAEIFTLGGSKDRWTLTNSAGQKLGATAVKTLVDNTGTTTWSISISGGNATIQNGTSAYGNFRHNVTYTRFTTYSSAVTTDICLPQIYVRSEVENTTAIYTTAICAHTSITEVPGKAAGCTTDGYTAGVFCNDCRVYLSGHETIQATGHNHVPVVTAPTVDTDGYTTYTCSGCGDSYVTDTVPALGETRVVTFCVPFDSAKVAPMECNNHGITLPEAQSPSDSWTFIGWTTQMVDNSTTEPEYYEAGSLYVAPGDITLYALFIHAEGGSGETVYTLVENAGDLAAGDKVVIAASGYNKALSTTQNGNNRGTAAITKSSDKKSITFGSDVDVLTLGNGTTSGTWSFYSENGSAGKGYLYAASTSKNYLRTQTTLNASGSFTITISSSGVATIKSKGNTSRGWMRYNNSSNIFACYSSGQADICLYKETVSGSVTYTTEIAHVHNGYHVDAKPASCTEAGNIEYYICACGKKYTDATCSTEITDSVVIPQLEHSYTEQREEDAYLHTAATCMDCGVYYTSCATCDASSKGTASEATFTSNAKNPDNHVGGTYLDGESAASCYIDGYTGDVCCASCQQVITPGQPIPAQHNLSPVAEVPATHLATGVAAHYKCGVCGKLFADDQASQEVTAEQLITPMIPHEFGEFQMNDEKHWKECTCGTISEEGTHTFGAWERVEAELDAVGMMQRKCSACGYIETRTIEITKQPENVTATVGDTAIFSVEATGEGLTYQWQFSKNSIYWGNYAATGAEMSIKATQARNGFYYRCQITDAEGNTVYTNAAQLTVEEPKIAIEITKQPENVTATVGDAATFSVEAAGEALTYQWQYSKTGKYWGDYAATSAEMSIKATQARNGYFYRCEITDFEGNIVYTNAAQLTVEEPKITIEITKQPENVTATVGNTATFSVEATGEGLTYQWQYSKNGSYWGNYAATGAEMSIKATQARNGFYYRCQITDAEGNTVYTNAAQLTVEEPKITIEIIKQPENVTATVGDTATFSVEATGEDLTYQWQYSKNGNYWGDYASTDAEMSVKATEARNGYYYHCVITDAKGNTATTQFAQLTVTT